MNSRTGMVVFSIVAVVCLLTANFVLWLNNTIYNRTNFSQTTVTVLQKTAVRNAVSSEIVDRVIKELPENIEVPKSVIEGPAQSIISGLLSNPSFKPVLDNFADQLNQVITSKPKAIKIDTTDIKKDAKPLVDRINREIRNDIQLDDLPDSIVLVKKGAVPSVFGGSVFLLWLGPVLGVIGIAIVVAMILVPTRENRPTALKILGLTLAVGSVVFIALTGLMRTPMTASISDENMRVIADGMYTAFSSSLINQTWILAIAGAIILAAGFLLPLILKPSKPAKVKRARKKAA